MRINESHRVTDDVEDLPSDFSSDRSVDALVEIARSFATGVVQNKTGKSVAYDDVEVQEVRLYIDQQPEDAPVECLEVVARADVECHECGADLRADGSCTSCQLPAGSA